MFFLFSSHPSFFPYSLPSILSTFFHSFFVSLIPTLFHFIPPSHSFLLLLFQFRFPLYFVLLPYLHFFFINSNLYFPAHRLSFLPFSFPSYLFCFLHTFIHSSHPSCSFHLPFYFSSFFLSFFPSFLLSCLNSFLSSSLLLPFFLSSFLLFFFPSFLLPPFHRSILNISKYHTYIDANFPYPIIRQFNLYPSIFQSVHSYTHYYVFHPFFKLTSTNVQIYKLQPSKQSRYILNRPFLRPYIHIIISHPSIHPPSLLHIIQNST